MPAKLSQKAAAYAPHRRSMPSAATDKLQDVTGVKKMRAQLTASSKDAHFQKVIVGVTLFGVVATVMSALASLCAYAEGGLYWSIMAVTEEEALAMDFESQEAYRNRRSRSRSPRTPSRAPGARGSARAPSSRER